MTKTTAAKLCALLGSKAHGNAAPWDAEIREGYLLFFLSVPEEVGQLLVPALLRGTKFREPLGEVIELAERIEHGQTPGVAEALEDAFAKRRRLGARAVQDGWLTPRCWDYRAPGGPALVQCGPPIPNMVEGDPPFADPLTARVVGIVGGWAAFCAVPQANEHWLRREFERLYHALHGGAQGPLLARLHQQYREAKAALPPPPVASLPAPQEEGDAPPISRAEASQIMAGLEARLPGLAALPLPHRERSAVRLDREKETA